VSHGSLSDRHFETIILLPISSRLPHCNFPPTSSIVRTGLYRVICSTSASVTTLRDVRVSGDSRCNISDFSLGLNPSTFPSFKLLGVPDAASSWHFRATNLRRRVGKSPFFEFICLPLVQCYPKLPYTNRYATSAIFKYDKNGPTFSPQPQRLGFRELA